MSVDPSQRPSLRPFRPEAFGNFTLLAPLGAGGMGEIFLARSTIQGGLNRFCAIKRILPHLANDPEFVTRFLDEIRTLLQLQHGSIAQVYDAGSYGDEYWISLEFVDGKDLRRLLQRARSIGDRFPLELALFISIKVLEALAYAHRKKDDDGRELGLVHRDVSPQNILLSYEGEVKVIDFGLAESKTTVAKNPVESVLGKLYYMAPEQGRGEMVDRRSDLYAVGVVLWEMLTGSNPFEAVAREELLHRITDPRLPPIATVDPTLPPSVAAVVDRALSPEPFRRFATAEEMRSRLAACLSELAPDVGPEALGRWLTQLFRDEYHRERELFSRLAAKREVASYDPDLETQLVATHRLPEAPPHEAATEVFLQPTPLPWKERPYFPEPAGEPREEPGVDGASDAPREAAPTHVGGGDSGAGRPGHLVAEPDSGPWGLGSGGTSEERSRPAGEEPSSPGRDSAPGAGEAAPSRAKARVAVLALLPVVALVAWLGLRVLGDPARDVDPMAARPGAVDPATVDATPATRDRPAPDAPVAPVEAGAPAEAEGESETPAPLLAPEELLVYGRPPVNLAPEPPPQPEPTPRPRARRPAAQTAPPPDDPAQRRAQLEARWDQLHRRFVALVERHGEDRVGTIALHMKQAAETSLHRFIDDSAEYGTLERQLQALERIVREREDALR